MFYTYLWLREDGTPYYVGKGFGRRAHIDHWLKGRVRRVPPKERIVIYPAESEKDAFDTECALIWYYGRKDLGTGILRNLTDGGEGPSGAVPSASTRELLSIAGSTPAMKEHLRRISTFASSSKGGRRGGLTNAKSGHMERMRTFAASSSGGKIQGPRNVANGHLQRIGRIGGRAAVTSGQLKSVCAKAGHVSGHLRWHVKRGILNPNCDLCMQETQ